MRRRVGTSNKGGSTTEGAWEASLSPEGVRFPSPPSGTGGQAAWITGIPPLQYPAEEVLCISTGEGPTTICHLPWKATLFSWAGDSVPHWETLRIWEAPVKGISTQQTARQRKHHCSHEPETLFPHLEAQSGLIWVSNFHPLRQQQQGPVGVSVAPDTPSMLKN